jgi:SPP1 gp7 family putative phage head morphogenesis protein
MPDRTDPEVIRMLREFRRSLLAREDAQLDRMAEAWLQIELDLGAEMEALAFQILEAKSSGAVITEQLVWRMAKYQRMVEKIDREVNRFLRDVAIADIEAEQLAFGEVGLSMAQGVLAAQVIGLGVQFDPLSTDAIETYIGFLGDGTPLNRLLVEAFPESVDGIIRGLLDGVAHGLGPNEIARRMADGMGMGLERITLIARTEQLRVWRATAADQYKASGLEGVQKRLVTKDDRTCMACLVSDGEITPADEPLDDHPRGRCTSVFQIKGAPEILWPTAQAWFMEQPDEVQQSMMGMDKWVAWINGQIELSDLRRTDHSPIWGDSPRVATLAELGIERGAVVRQEPAREPVFDFDAAEAQAQLEAEFAGPPPDDVEVEAQRKQVREDERIERAMNAIMPPAPVVLEPDGKILPQRQDTSETRTSDNGQQIIPSKGPSGEPGAFDSARVTIVGNGDAIIKTNVDPGGEAWGDEGITAGFARREVMAYDLDQALGIGLVPQTTSFMEDGEFLSLQLWIENSQIGRGVSSGELADPAEIGRLALLDMITGNEDRHGGNWLLTSNDHLVAIDNGLALTSTDLDPFRVFNRIFSRFTAFGEVAYQKDNFRIGQRHLPLGDEFRDRLRDMIDSGELMRILSSAPSGDPDADQELVDAAMARARTVVRDWDKFFQGD